MTNEQQFAIMHQCPDSAFCFITLAARKDGTVEVYQCDLFGNNMAAICSAVAKLKEIQSFMEEDSDKALIDKLQNPQEEYGDDDDDN